MPNRLDGEVDTTWVVLRCATGKEQVMTWWRSLYPEDQVTIVFCAGSILILLVFGVGMTMLFRGM